MREIVFQSLAFKSLIEGSVTLSVFHTFSAKYLLYRLMPPSAVWCEFLFHSRFRSYCLTATTKKCADRAFVQMLALD